MKNFLKTRFSFNKFAFSVFILFLAIIGLKTGKFFWDSRNISQQKVSMMAQNSYVPNGAGNLFIGLTKATNHVSLTDFFNSITDEPIDIAEAKLSLEKPNGEKIGNLGASVINNGSLNMGFQLPELAVGKYNLVLDVDSEYGHDTVKKSIEIKSQISLVITTDSPLYKPGQSMNFRALMIDKLTLKPIEGRDLVITVIDPENNKLFRKSFKSSRYGIISGNFSFAEELAFGEYKLVAEIDQTKKEKTVEVKDFQLPKFEVTLDTDQNLAEQQAEISGRVLARFFHGQPVSGAKTTVSLQIGNSKQSYQGVTDSEGILKFNFSGLGSSTACEISLSAHVTDNSRNEINAQKTALITGDGINVELFPEAGKLMPGLENEILIIASRPDGTPAKASIFMTGEKIREFSTNDSGLAKFAYKPDSGSDTSRFDLDVRDDQGNAVKKAFTLNNEAHQIAYLILRPDKTIYKDKAMDISVLATQDKAAKVELLKDGLVISSEAIDIKDGQGEKTIAIPDKAFGTLELRVMQIFSPSESRNLATNHGSYDRQQSDKPLIISDSRIIFVDRAKNLNVAISSDKESYLPGEEAKFNFQISDDANGAENSALGVKIVDEALLALGGDDNGLSSFPFLVDDNVRDYAVSLNGLIWEDVLKNPDNGLNNIILSAMLKNVPREKAALGSIEKDNSGAWESYQEAKTNLFRMLLLALIFILIISCISFWWKISAYAKEKSKIQHIWLSAFAVSILTVFSGTLFIQSEIYEDFSDTIRKSLDFFSSFFSNISVTPFFLDALLAISAGLAYLAWNKRQMLISRFKTMARLLFVILGLMSLFATLNNFGIGITDTISEDFWIYISTLGASTIIFGLLYFRVINNSENGSNNILSYLYIFLIGILIPVFNQVMIPLFFFLALFAFIRAFHVKDGGYLEIEERITALEKKLSAEQGGNNALELELMRLKTELDGYGSGPAVSIILISMLVVGALSFSFLFMTGNASVLKYFLTISFFFSLLMLVIGIIRYSLNLHYGATKPMAIIGLVGLILSVFSYMVINFTLSPTTSVIESPDGYYGSSRPMLNDSGGPDLGLDYVENTGLSSGSSNVTLRNPLGAGTDKGSLLDDLSLDGGGSIEQAKITEGEVAISNQENVEFQKAKRIRKFFPETMYWDAELIAENGQAELSLPMKDSITSWRLSALANSLSGKVGSADKNVIVFQDFFIDFSLPFNLSEGDDFWLPVSVSNYLGTGQKIRLKLLKSDFYDWLEGGQDDIDLQAGEVRDVYLRLRLKKYGDFALRIEAQGTKMADAAEKTLSVSPYGRFVSQTVLSEKLNEDKITVNPAFPKDTIAGTEKLVAKLYPSVFSEIVQGLDGMLRLPSGCFEQTSSSLYPNILILKYINKAGKDSPEIRAKAEDYISQGVQRLLTYELEPGGFSYWGHEPIETILTAYGLMEFSEMRDATFVDEDLISRTRNYLLSQQNHDGSFNLTGGHNGGFSGGDDLAKNAYIIWALSEADPKNAQLGKSIDFLKDNLDALAQSPYALALAANAFANYDPGADYAKDALSRLKRLIIRDEDGLAYIKLDRANYFGSYGQAGNIEVSSLAAIAIANSGDIESSDSLIRYITKQKSGNGSWGSTQATILALKALTENEIAKNTVKDNLGGIDIIVNGQKPATFELNSENSEVVQSLALSQGLAANNEVTISKRGKISGTLQISKEYFGSWNDSQSSASNDLEIRQEFGLDDSGNVSTIDSPVLALGQAKNLYVSVKSKTSLKNAVVEISLPAGFEANTVSLTCQLSSNMDNEECRPYRSITGTGLSRFEIKAGRIILYIDTLAANEVSAYAIGFTPKIAGSFKIRPARSYAYYDPYNEAYSRPLGRIEVK